MKVEFVKYSVSGLGCRGALVYDDGVRARRPLLLVAPNWLGVTENVLERAKVLAGNRYVVFVADMFEAEMDATGARWYSLIFGNVAHAYTDVGVNNPPVAIYDEPATRHGYVLAHAFIEDAFAGRI